MRMHKHKHDGWANDPNKVYMDPAPPAEVNTDISPDSYGTPDVYGSDAPKQGWVRKYQPFSNGLSIQGGNPDSFSLNSNN